jgi:hypothetical protein
MKIINCCISLIKSLIKRVFNAMKKNLSLQQHSELELKRIHKLHNKTTVAHAKQAKAIAKQLGNDYIIQQDNEQITVAWYVNQIIQNSRRSQFLSAAGLKFDGNAISTRDFAEQIAIHTHGTYQKKHGRDIVTKSGQKIKDPLDFVIYEGEHDFEKAYNWIALHGEKISYYNEHNILANGVKIKKYLVKDATITLGMTSKFPKKIYSLSVSTKPYVKNTNLSANLTTVCNEMADIKRLINQSKKLILQDQAKLNAIVAAAEDFKEIE